MTCLLLRIDLWFIILLVTNKSHVLPGTSEQVGGLNPVQFFVLRVTFLVLVTAYLNDCDLVFILFLYFNSYYNIVLVVCFCLE